MLIVPGCGGPLCQNTWGEVPLRTYPLSATERAFMAKHNVKIVEVPWVTPPGISKNVGGCGRVVIHSAV